jgi:hypothetical protein
LPDGVRFLKQNKMKQRTIEETICPDADELRLIIDEDDKEDLGYYEANFLDEHWDVFKVKYLADDCATLDFCGNTYVKLSEHNLKMLLKWLRKTNDIYEQQINMMRNERKN